MISAICETLKYTVKEQDLVGSLCDSDSVNSLWLKRITEQLYKTRKVEYKGVLKEMGKKLELAYNDDDLITINDKDDEIESDYLELTFSWYQTLGKYILKTDD
jgi:plasmid rolling circle replication initiator protein Rep